MKYSTAIDRDIEADAILSRDGSKEMVRVRFQVEEIFEPFAVTRYQQRRGLNSESRVVPLRALSGPAPSRSSCTRCNGPKRFGQDLCRICQQKRSLDEFHRVVEYWLKLWRQSEPDFSEALIERIDRRERRLGPAAFWPREESVL